MALDLTQLLSILPAEDGAKFKEIVEKNTTLSERLDGGERLLSAWGKQGGKLAELLEGELESAKTPKPAAELQSATFDLAKFNESFMPEVNKAIEAYGNRVAPQLQREIEYRSLSKMDELMNLKMKHQNDFKENISLNQITDYVEKHPGQFKTATDAYDDMVRERRNEAIINQKVQEQVQAKLREVQSTTGFPGTTPVQAETNPLFDYFNKGADTSQKDLAVQVLEEYQKEKLTAVN